MKSPRMLVRLAVVSVAVLFTASFVQAEDPQYEFASTPAFEDNFDPGWEQSQQDWFVATWKQNGSHMAEERCKTNGEGMMVQTVLAGDPPRGGSMQTKGEFGYGRWVARVKPSSVPGVLNSIFTKDWDDKSRPDTSGKGGMSEVDIEFLTSKHKENSAEVHLAIHLKGRNNFYTHYQEVDFNPSDDFHDWGFDILPDRVDWRVDGKIIHTWHYTDDAKIDPNYEFFFNSWTMKKWIEGPPTEDATYEIDWIKFYPIKEG